MAEEKYGEIKLSYGKLRRFDGVHEGFYIDIGRDCIWKEKYQFIPVFFNKPFTRYFIHFENIYEGNNEYVPILIDNYGQQYSTTTWRVPCKKIHVTKIGRPNTMSDMLEKNFGFYIDEDNKTYIKPLSMDTINFIKSKKYDGKYSNISSCGNARYLCAFDKVIEMDKEISELKKEFEELKAKNINLLKYTTKGEIYIPSEEDWIGDETRTYELAILVDDFVDDEKYYKKYDNYTVKGSWDNWEKEYSIRDLIIINYTNDGLLHYGITLDFLPPEGIYRYKLKNNGEWIEPDTTELREKDHKGNWNNLITIHYEYT